MVFLALALQWDCRISIVSERHAPANGSGVGYGRDRPASLGIEAERIIKILIGRPADRAVQPRGVDRPLA